MTWCFNFSDRWTHIQRRLLINFITVSVNEPILLKALDESGEYKDIEYLKWLFIDMIKKVGRNNIVKIITR